MCAECRHVICICLHQMRNCKCEFENGMWMLQAESTVWNEQRQNRELTWIKKSLNEKEFIRKDIELDAIVVASVIMVVCERAWQWVVALAAVVDSMRSHSHQRIRREICSEDCARDQQRWLPFLVSVICTLSVFHLTHWNDSQLWSCGAVMLRCTPLIAALANHSLPPPRKCHRNVCRIHAMHSLYYLFARDAWENDSITHTRPNCGEYDDERHTSFLFYCHLQLLCACKMYNLYIYIILYATCAAMSIDSFSVQNGSYRVYFMSMRCGGKTFWIYYYLETVEWKENMVHNFHNNKYIKVEVNGYEWISKWKISNGNLNYIKIFDMASCVCVWLGGGGGVCRRVPAKPDVYVCIVYTPCKFQKYRGVRAWLLRSYSSSLCQLRYWMLNMSAAERQNISRVESDERNAQINIACNWSEHSIYNVLYVCVFSSSYHEPFENEYWLGVETCGLQKVERLRFDCFFFLSIINIVNECLRYNKVQAFIVFVAVAWGCVVRQINVQT